MKYSFAITLFALILSTGVSSQSIGTDWRKLTKSEIEEIRTSQFSWLGSEKVKVVYTIRSFQNYHSTIPEDIQQGEWRIAGKFAWSKMADTEAYTSSEMTVVVDHHHRQIYLEHPHPQFDTAFPGLWNDFIKDDCTVSARTKGEQKVVRIQYPAYMEMAMTDLVFESGKLKKSILYLRALDTPSETDEAVRPRIEFEFQSMDFNSDFSDKSVQPSAAYVQSSNSLKATTRYSGYSVIDSRLH